MLLATAGDKDLFQSNVLIWKRTWKVSGQKLEEKVPTAVLYAEGVCCLTETFLSWNQPAKLWLGQPSSLNGKCKSLL